MYCDQCMHRGAIASPIVLGRSGPSVADLQGVIDYEEEERGEEGGGKEIINRRHGEMETSFHTTETTSGLSVSGTSGPKFLWDGYLTQTGKTVIYGRRECGKTTLIAGLIRAFQKGDTEYCGRALSSHPKVLYISEEAEYFWQIRCQRLGLDKKMMHLICQPFVHKPSVKEWEDMVSGWAAQAVKEGIGLVVLDSLPILWAVKKESEGADLQTSLVPLNSFSRRGVSVLATAYPPRRGNWTRGSGAMEEFFDFAFGMEYLQQQHKNTDNRRALRRTKSRLREETPRELVLDYEASRGIFSVWHGQ